MSVRIYKYRCDGDVFDSLSLRSRSGHDDVLNKLLGQPVGQAWTPLKAKFYRVGRQGDFPYLAGHVPAFSKRALSALSPLLGDTIEPLPLVTPSGTYSAIHVLEVIDALDLNRSKVEWLDEDRILDIERYVFKPEAVQGKHIFRIRQHALAFTYVSEAFRQAVEESALEGLALKEV